MQGPWAKLSQRERDAAYNNSDAVTNSAALIEQRNAASSAFRAAHAKAHPGLLDVAYGKGERTKLDLYPAKTATAPCLVFIHGGYWQRNAREDFAVYAQGVAAHGWATAIPGYTLAPDASLAQIVGEIDAALSWLVDHGLEKSIAGGPIIVSGWSAGGHLTAMALAHRGVTAGLALSGVYELAPIRDTYLNEKLRLSDAEIASLSPLRLPVVDKPLAIAYGTNELPALVADSRDLHARRSAAHAAGALIPVPRTDHFTMLDELRKPDGVLVKAALSLVA